MRYSLNSIDMSTISLDTRLFYKGTVKELPKNASSGTVVYCDGATWINTDIGWDPILPMDSDCGYYSKEEVHIIYPTNCKNCGAILHDNICEYCGSDNGEYKRY